MPPLRLRCLTLNLWGAEPPLDARMDLVIAALADLRPDVVALQEVQEVPDRLPNTAARLAASLGLKCVFAPTVAFRGGHEGLAIISGLSIETHDVFELPHATETERRILLSLRLATPSGPLWVHTTHLNYRPQHGREREDQVMAIDDRLRTFTPDNPQILMGDFNARPESDEIRWLKGLTTLGGRRTFYQDAWDTLHPADPGITWAARNPGTASLAFLGLDRRLDYVFVTPRRRDGRGHIQNCQIVLDRPDAAGIFPSDHFGVMVDVQVTPDE